MKRFLLVLMMAAALQVVRGDNLRSIERKLVALPIEIERAVRDHAKYAAKESELQLRIQNLPAGSPDAERLKEEIEEVHEIVQLSTQQEKSHRDELRQIQASPELAAIAALGNDHRRPSRADLSGVWASRPNLVGYVIQLEQSGKFISGWGYHWGCMGDYDMFAVNGSYEGGKLSLTFQSPTAQSNHQCRYRYSEDRNQPQFKVPHSEPDEWMSPIAARFKKRKGG